MPPIEVHRLITAPPLIPAHTMAGLITFAVGAALMAGAAFTQRPVHCRGLLVGRVIPREHDPSANRHRLLHTSLFGIGVFLVGAVFSFYSYGDQTKQHFAAVAQTVISSTGGAIDPDTARWEQPKTLALDGYGATWRCTISPADYSPLAQAFGALDEPLSMTCSTGGTA